MQDSAQVRQRGLRILLVLDDKAGSGGPADDPQHLLQVRGQVVQEG
ncbi:MAG: hypothetical protein ACLPUO_09140 [Streptosporangiaceae bacterium]